MVTLNQMSLGIIVLLFAFLVILLLLHLQSMRSANEKLNQSLQEAAEINKKLEASNEEIAYNYKIISELQRVMNSALWVYKYDESGYKGKLRRSKEHLELFGSDGDKGWKAGIYHEDRAKVEDAILGALNDLEDCKDFRITYRVKNSKDSYIWVNSAFKSVHHEDGRPDMLIGIDTDITKEYEHDSVTEGVNYRGFIRKADEVMETAATTDSYAVLYFNLKNFKAFNELYNRTSGNRLLKAYYQYLEASSLGCLALGRNEDHFFCLVKYHEGILEQIEAVCEFEYVNNNRSLFVYANCGIYCLKSVEKPVDVTQLLDKAKLAQDSITSESPHSYGFYEEHLRDNYINDAIALAELNKALEEEQFKIYFHPIVDTFTGKLASCEALVRWYHPEKGILSPDKFVVALEKQGYLSDLDAYVVRQVGKFYKERLEQQLPVVPVSINVSWQDFRDRAYVQELFNLVELVGEHKEFLRFEITESSFIKLDVQIEKIIYDLRLAGATFLIDDFGTGYSSYSMLQNFNFDVMKIDMSFSRKIGINKKTDQLLRSIIEMSHHLGIKCVAEGVENEAQLNFYKKQGCEYIQGYYFYKPMLGQDFCELLDKEKVE